MGTKQVHSAQAWTKETTFAAAYRLCSDSAEDPAFVYMHACVSVCVHSPKLSGDVSHGELSPFPLATLSLSQARLVLSFRRDWEIFPHTHTHTSILKLTPSCKAGQGVRLLA